MRPSPVPSPPPGFVRSVANKLSDLSDKALAAASSAVHEVNTAGMVDQRARRHQTALGHLVKYVEHAHNRALVLDAAMRQEDVGKDRPLALLASEPSGNPILTTLYWAGGAEPVYKPGPWQTRFLGGLGMTTAFFDPPDVLLHLACLAVKDRDAEMRASEAELARERDGADQQRGDLESVSRRLAAATEELRDRDAETSRLRAMVDRLESETARATERVAFWRSMNDSDSPAVESEAAAPVAAADEPAPATERAPWASELPDFRRPVDGHVGIFQRETRKGTAFEVRVNDKRTTVKNEDGSLADLDAAIAFRDSQVRQPA